MFASLSSSDVIPGFPEIPNPGKSRDLAFPESRDILVGIFRDSGFLFSENLKKIEAFSKISNIFHLKCFKMISKFNFAHNNEILRVFYLVLTKLTSY